MDDLDKKQLVQAATRGTLLGNAIVLVAPKDGGPASAKIADLPALLGRDGRRAMVDSNPLPAGKHRSEALEHPKLGDDVHGRLPPAAAVHTPVGGGPGAHDTC